MGANVASTRTGIAVIVGVALAASATVLTAAAIDHRGVFARQPAALKVLWTIWLVAVSVNVVVWVLVSGTTGHLQYPWPLWVAGPYGAALLAVSVAVAQFRRGRGPDGPPSLPPGQP